MTDAAADSPAELVSRASRGERAAEEALCLRFAPAVRAFARRRLRGADAVEEFAQDVLTWLKTIKDVSWDPTDGTLYALCEAPLARIASQQPHVVSKIIGHRSGQAQTIAVFETFLSS